MRRVLMVCYYFPPLGGIGSVRALKFGSYLPEFGWEPTVLTPRNGSFFRDGELTFPEQQVVRTATLEVSRLGKRALGLGGESQAAEATAGLGFLRQFTRRWLYRPDAQVGWYPFAVRAGLKAVGSRRYDAIFSSSFPITAHLVAQRLQQASGLPWVAEFRDPWTHRAHYDSPTRRRLDEKMERRILSAASAVITVSRCWAALLRGGGAKQIHVLTNGFDPGDFPTDIRPMRQTVTYLGSYYPREQDLRTALQAISRAVSDGPLTDLRLRFIGHRSPHLAELVAECGLSDRAEFTGFVSHRESLHLLCESTFLILAGTLLDDSRRQILRGILPGKMFEYLGARRPILYVGDLDSEAATLLRDIGGSRLVAAGDTEAARRAIASLVGGGELPNESRLEPLTRRATSSRLAGILDALV